MSSISPEKSSEIDTQLQEYIDQQEVGAIVGLGSKDGQIFYINKFGFQNVKEQIPIRYDSIFRFNSMTKPIVSVAALQLWESIGLGSPRSSLRG